MDVKLMMMMMMMMMEFILHEDLEIFDLSDHDHKNKWGISIEPGLCYHTMLR